MPSRGWPMKLDNAKEVKASSLAKFHLIVKRDCVFYFKGGVSLYNPTLG